MDIWLWCSQILQIHWSSRHDLINSSLSLITILEHLTTKKKVMTCRKILWRVDQNVTRWFVTRWLQFIIFFTNFLSVYNIKSRVHCSNQKVKLRLPRKRCQLLWMFSNLTIYLILLTSCWLSVSVFNVTSWFPNASKPRVLSFFLSFF